MRVTAWSRTSSRRRTIIHPATRTTRSITTSRSLVTTRRPARSTSPTRRTSRQQPLLAQPRSALDADPAEGLRTYRCGVGRTVGQIDARYQAFGGCDSFLGAALTDEITTPDGAGRYNVFRTARSTGRRAPARSRYTARFATSGTRSAGRPASSAIRYRTRPRRADDVGRFSVFQHGSIYWSPRPARTRSAARFATRGRRQDGRSGALGYPTSDEYAVPEGRRSDFQHGRSPGTRRRTRPR